MEEKRATAMAKWEEARLEEENIEGVWEDDQMPIGLWLKVVFG